MESVARSEMKSCCRNHNFVNAGKKEDNGNTPDIYYFFRHTLASF